VFTRPMVSVMIATRDRAPELQSTLELLRLQRYEPLEIVVVDDGSAESMESLVRQFWPCATVIRHAESRGQSQRRNEGFAASHGEFILQLDDDCCFTEPGDLGRAVQYLAERPKAAGVIFDLFNGPVMPEGLPASSSRPGCVLSFVGAAILFRATAILEVAGYRPFFQRQREEDELSLQLLAKGWQILYYPRILAHHRLSVLNRHSVNAWRLGLRNEIWMIVLHFPIWRWPAEIGWKLLIGFWDACRLVRLGAFCRAIGSCVLGIWRILQLRDPLPKLALSRYDALRLRSVLTPSEFDNPPAFTLRDLREWWSRWRNRARDNSVWESQRTGKGSSHTSRFAHEFPMLRNESLNSGSVVDNALSGSAAPPANSRKAHDSSINGLE
jgi:GT2 family glycosyltransferase